jgi:hypothetical protein
MASALTAVIDSVLDFALGHAGQPLGPSTLLTAEQWNELSELDTELFAQCFVNGLPLPDYTNPLPETWAIFKNCKLPYGRVRVHQPVKDESGRVTRDEVSEGVQIYPTPEWVRALKSLRAAAVARRGGAGRVKTPRKRGRPVDTDPKADKRVYEAWKSGHYPNYSELARELKMSQGDMKRAIDRHRKRVERGGG